MNVHIYFKHKTKLSITFQVMFDYTKFNTIILPNHEIYTIEPNSRILYNKIRLICVCQSYKPERCREQIIPINTENMIYSQLFEYLVEFFKNTTIKKIQLNNYDPLWIDCDTQYDHKTKSIRFNTSDYIISLKDEDFYTQFCEYGYTIDNYKQLEDIEKHKFVKTIKFGQNLTPNDVENCEFPRLDEIHINYLGLFVNLEKYINVTKLSIKDKHLYWTWNTDILNDMTQLQYLHVKTNPSNIYKTLKNIKNHTNLHTLNLHFFGTLSRDHEQVLIEFIDGNKTIKCLIIDDYKLYRCALTENIINTIIDNSQIEKIKYNAKKCVSYDEIKLKVSDETFRKLLQSSINFKGMIDIYIGNITPNNHKELYHKYAKIITDLINEYIYTNNTIITFIHHISNNSLFNTHIKNYKIYTKSLIKRSTRPPIST